MAPSKQPQKSYKVRLSDTNSTSRDAKAVLSGRSKKGWFARLLPFLGPAFIASIAYVDPGNFATNIQGGAQFGYELLWVILGQQPDGHAPAGSLCQTRHRHRQEPGRALPRAFPASGRLDHVGSDGTGRHGHRPG